MPRQQRPSTCQRTGTISRYRDIFLGAFQTRQGNTQTLTWNDPSAYTTTTGTGNASTAYNGTVTAGVVQEVNGSFPYYDNLNNTGYLFNSSQGRTFDGIFTATQAINVDLDVFDVFEAVVISDANNKSIRLQVSDGTNTSILSATLPLANTPYRVVWNPTQIGITSSSNSSIGGTVTGTAPSGTATSITFQSLSNNGEVTIFANYFATHNLQLPGSVLTPKPCCLEEIEITKEQDTTDRTCQGEVVGKLVTSETRTITLTVKEIDLWSLAVFSGAVPQFEKNKLAKELNTGTAIPTNATGDEEFINIGTNLELACVMINEQVLNYTPARDNLDYGQYNYDPATGELWVNGLLYGGQTPSIRASSEATRLSLCEQAKSLGYKVYYEIPEYYENGEIRTKYGYGQVTSFTQTIEAEDDSTWEIEITETSDANGNFCTTFE
jgi:hypothetical protein